MLRIPGIWVAFVSFLVSTLSTGFLSITLESQILRKVGLMMPLIVMSVVDSLIGYEKKKCRDHVICCLSYEYVRLLCIIFYFNYYLLKSLVVSL